MVNTLICSLHFLADLLHWNSAIPVKLLNWDGLPFNVIYVDGVASAPAITFNLTVFLEGAYTLVGGSMKTSLLTSGVLPNSQPYAPGLPYYGNANPEWYYQGTENVTNLPAERC